jgi:putative phage-type endonuclease
MVGVSGGVAYAATDAEFADGVVDIEKRLTNASSVELVATAAQLERETWLAERRKGIGASDVGILFGVSPYGSLVSLWADKTGRPTPKRSAQSEMELRIGHELEGFVCQLAEEAAGVTIERNKASASMPGHPLVRATTDGFATGGGFVGRGCMDAKVVGAHNAHEWRDGAFPMLYRLQLQTQMSVTSCRWGLIAGLLLGSDPPLVYRVVQHDPELERIIVKRAEWFWRTYVETDLAPPVDDRPVTSAALAAMHPQDRKIMVKLDRSLERAMADWAAAKSEVAEAKRRMEYRANQIARALGDAAWGEFPNGNGVSLKTQKNSHGGTSRVMRPMKAPAVEKARKQSEEQLERMIREGM